MCGIAGIIARRSVNRQAVQTMINAIAHRGPDGEGIWSSDDGKVMLGHRRLAIIDPTPAGAQPMVDPSGQLVLTFNGEIYNYIELKEQMPGTAFATGSDCELPLHLYLEQGQEFTKSLRGMYALAVHDLVADRLVLARDPFGIKPLYYCEMANGFAFASEPQALIAAGLVTAALNPRQRDALLQLHDSFAEGNI